LPSGFVDSVCVPNFAPAVPAITQANAQPETIALHGLCPLSNNGANGRNTGRAAGSAADYFAKVEEAFRSVRFALYILRKGRHLQSSTWNPRSPVENHALEGACRVFP